MRNSKEYNNKKSGEYILKKVQQIRNTNCLRESQEEKRIHPLLVVVWVLETCLARAVISFATTRTSNSLHPNALNRPRLKIIIRPIKKRQIGKKMLSWVLDAIPSHWIHPDPNTAMLRRGERSGLMLCSNLLSSRYSNSTYGSHTTVAERMTVPLSLRCYNLGVRKSITA